MQAFEKKDRLAYVNFLRAKFEAYTGATTVQSYPYYLLVDPADVCQLRCTTCPTGLDNEARRRGDTAHLNRRQRSVMQPELFDAVLDEVGPYLFFLLLYNWGEPLLNPSIARFVTKARSHDIATEIHTNLSLRLSQRRIDALLDCGLDSLTVSVDGFSQEIYRVHRVGGDIDLVKKNLEALTAARDRLGSSTLITYKMLIFAHNEHEIPLARGYCEDLGIAFSSEHAAVPDPSWMPPSRREEIGQDALAVFQAATGDSAEDDPQRQSLLFPPREDESASPSFCSWHYGYSVVTAGGPVAPCCATGKADDDFGRVEVGERSFGQVWNNARLRRARAAMSGRVLPDGTDPTCCETCRFPPFVQQLYSIYDPRVLAGFHRTFETSEPLLNAAFRLLARGRYDLETRRQVKAGEFHPSMLASAGAGDETDRSCFVDFYRRHLTDLDGVDDPVV